MHLIYMRLLSVQGRRNRGGGSPPPTQFLADHLTLSQPGGHIMPTTLLRATPDFQIVDSCQISYLAKMLKLLVFRVWQII